ncbi:MAG: HAMP domain-containing histidine kinase, partial [Nitrospirae bacterium]|nr:HAMP domain-containing histidine kinase [Nitrospirota bacterium]
RGKEAELFNRVAVLFENRDCNSIDEFRDVLSRVLETVNAFCGIKKSMLFTNHHSDGKDMLKIFHMAASDACETHENIYLNMETIKGPEFHDFTCVTAKDVKEYLDATRHGLRRRDTQSIDFETVIRKGSENGISMAIAFGPREDAMPVTELIERELGFFQNLIFFLYSAINNKLTALDLMHKERLLQKKFVRLEQKVSDSAHEFKIRLQTIRTEADIWDMCCEKELRECALAESSRAYGNISSSIRDLSSYTNRALSGYSPEAFSLDGNAGELTDLSSFIGWCANRYDSLVRKESLSLSIDNTVNDLPEFLLDRDEFSCAMGNLIDNAVKYSMPGRDIHIFAGFHEDTFSINISNYGIGVCEDEKTRVFERNYRGRAAMTALKSKGQGIGLSETREIVRRHGGDITIDSRPEDPGSGCYKTVVTVTLPYKQKERGNHDKYIVG